MHQRHFKYADTMPTWCGGGSDLVALDLETTGLNPRQDAIHGLAFCWDAETAYYTTNKALIKDVVQRAKTHLFHNAEFDISFLQKADLYVNKPFHDTMLLANVYDPDSEIGLKPLSQRLLGDKSVTYASEMGVWLKANGLSKEDISRAPQQLLVNYACEDVANTWDLFHLFREKFKVLDSWVKDKYPANKLPSQHYKEEQLPLVPVIVDMQSRGARLDIPKFLIRKEEIKNEIKTTQVELNAATNDLTKQASVILWDKKVEFRKRKNKTGMLKVLPPAVVFNWDSNDHLKTVFFSLLGERPTRFTDKGNPSVDEAFLTGVSTKYSWVSLILKYKELRGALSKYFESKKVKSGEKPSDLLAIQEGGHVYPSYHLTGTTSGRLSSSNPNFQNLPKHGRIKELFIPRDGDCILHADYNQLELRLAAHLSGDKILLDAYRNNTDLHQHTAGILGITRDKAKTINFAIIYAASGFRVAEIMGYLSDIPVCSNKRPCDCKDCGRRKKAAQNGDEIIAQLFGEYKGLKKYLDVQKDKMLRYGVAITEFGRLIRLPDLKSQERWKFNHALKKGYNHPIQGLGASITKRAMVKAYASGLRIINQIHDAIQVEYPKERAEEGARILQECMESAVRLDVPLKVEVKILSSMEDKCAV